MYGIFCEKYRMSGICWVYVVRGKVPYVRYFFMKSTVCPVFVGYVVSSVYVQEKYRASGICFEKYHMSGICWVYVVRGKVRYVRNFFMKSTECPVFVGYVVSSVYVQEKYRTSGIFL